MLDCWIDKEGKIHEDGNHRQIANKLFPKSKNAELSCEKAGFVKLGTDRNGHAMMENYNPETAEQAQINTVSLLWAAYYKKRKKQTHEK